eukprot:1679763-Prymnesium_polylepis.1
MCALRDPPAGSVPARRSRGAIVIVPPCACSTERRADVRCPQYVQRKPTPAPRSVACDPAGCRMRHDDLPCPHAAGAEVPSEQCEA